MEKVNNLQNFFAPLISEYKEIMNTPAPDMGKIRNIYKQIREKVIAEITVRRTRKDLRKYSKYLDDLKEQGIIFPEIAPLQTIEYQLDTSLGKLFYETIFNLTDDDKIGYYRYQAIRFLNKEIRDKYYEKAEMVSQSLAGIMKTLMVKTIGK